MKGKDMTKSEKKKTAYEKLKQKEAEKTQVCVTAKTLFSNCDSCEFNSKKQTFANDGEKRFVCKCNKKARKDLEVLYDEFTNELKSVMVGFYPYCIVNGKCDSLVVMRMEDEFENFK